MNPAKIVEARKRQGLTQEELADQAGITVRTIQRIENGESIPRSYTLKAIAAALNLSFADLQQTEHTATAVTNAADDDTVHFLQLLVVSCFGYILIPFIHFLLPAYLLKKRRGLNPEALRFARKLLRGQVYWVIAFNSCMLLTVAWNLISKHNHLHLPRISYLAILFVMFLVNAVLILGALIRLKRLNCFSAA